MWDPPPEEPLPEDYPHPEYVEPEPEIYYGSPLLPSNGESLADWLHPAFVPYGEGVGDVGEISFARDEEHAIERCIEGAPRYREGINDLLRSPPRWLYWAIRHFTLEDGHGKFFPLPLGAWKLIREFLFRPWVGIAITRRLILVEGREPRVPNPLSQTWGLEWSRHVIYRQTRPKPLPFEVLFEIRTAEAWSDDDSTW